MDNSDKHAAGKKPIPIVSSAHLAAKEGWELSELEYAMTMTYNAFSRWMVHCMASVGYKDLNPLDILILHNVNHRTREKRLADIGFMLNIDDAHTINYAIKKLVKVGLVVGTSRARKYFTGLRTWGWMYVSAIAMCASPAWWMRRLPPSKIWMKYPTPP